MIGRVVAPSRATTRPITYSKVVIRAVRKMIPIPSTGNLVLKRDRLPIGKLAVTSMILLSGCTPDPQRQAVMANIESAIRLLTDAAPLPRYARAYAKGVGTHVVALYFIPAAPDLKMCDAAVPQKAESLTVAQLCPAPRGMVAGERRWFDDLAHPDHSKPGKCARIDVSYDMDRHKVVKVRCQGKGAAGWQAGGRRPGRQSQSQ